jgi:hypothetical protein
MHRLLLLAIVPLLLAAETQPRPRVAEVKRYRLELTVPYQSGIYFSAWAVGDKLGDAILDHDGSNGRTVVFKRWFVWYDRCTWEATETITPTAADRYDYAYREAPIRCPEGAVADVDAATPRDGKVKVYPTDPSRKLTPLTAWADGWDQPR